jgi:lipoprotein-releasing system permease protein
MSSRTRALLAGTVLAGAGLAELVLGLARGGVAGPAVGELLVGLVGWGTLAGLLLALGSAATGPATAEAVRLTQPVAAALDGAALHLGLGAVLWVAGWVLLALALQGPRAEAGARSPAAGSRLHPRMGHEVDLHWGTLTAYGFGILLAELAFIGVYLLLVGKGSAQGSVVEGGLSPVAAFVWSLSLATAVAFGGGFLGAANSRRLSTPEATIALLYFGLPVPALLSAMHANSTLMFKLGFRLKELVYLASLLGENRPELGYWLVTLALMLALFLGINLGFVSTSSGRLDLRASYELFIARRHVQVFRPRLLLGAFAVLILGIIPPLLVWAIVQAAEVAVERTRIRLLGLQDPLAAAEALHALKARAQSPTAMMTALSLGGVGVGVMALIIVLSVMSGFEADLQKKILGTNAHGVVVKYGPDMEEYPEVLRKVRTVRGITGATPFIMNEVMISSEGNISGSMIKGIDPDTVGTVTDLPEYMLPGGKLQWLKEPSRISAQRLTTLDGLALDDRPVERPVERPSPARGAGPEDLEHDPLVRLAPAVGAEPTLPGIVVGRELAAQLKVRVGDRVNVVSPLGGELGPQGPMPRSRPFRVAGLFYSGMYEYDSKFVYILLSEAQAFFNVKGATGVEVKVADVDNARGIMKAVYDLLDGYPYRTKDWGEMNRNLFAALRLEKLVMGIILSIIVIVAAGLIVATVIMLVLEKRKEIAVLKALGVPDGGIVKIFLFEGLQIGVAGGVLGLVAGLAWCLFIEKVGIRLDPQVYYIPALPVRIEPFQTALSVVIAVLITFLASIYPALKASQVEPVDGLKSE